MPRGSYAASLDPQYQTGAVDMTDQVDNAATLHQMKMAWDRVGDATKWVAENLPGQPDGVAALSDATGELVMAAVEIDGAARELTGEVKPEAPGDVELLWAALAFAEELPPAGTSRDKWTDVQVLLGAAYRLADLADVLESRGQRPDPSPSEVALMLTRANAVLDSARD